MVKDSEKAMICVKIAWLYRLKNDRENEKKFLYPALQGLIKAYEYELLPVAGMDGPSLEYLI